MSSRFNINLDAIDVSYHLDSTSCYPGIVLENRTASLASLQDVNAAQKLLDRTDPQILSQAEISDLYTARPMPASLLKMLE